MLGWILTTVSQLAVSAFVIGIMIDRINTGPLSWVTILGCVYALCGNLGMCLLTAHIILHNDPLREQIKDWLDVRHK